MPLLGLFANGFTVGLAVGNPTPASVGIGILAAAVAVAILRSA
jgi:hypothetical protein